MKWKKVFLILISIFMFVLVLLGYSLFYGMPFKKEMVAKELETHLEAKYKTDLHLQKAQYNFVDGNYSGIFYPETQKKLEFRAEKWSWNESYYDEYPEAIWKNQATEDLTPIIKANFYSYEELIIAGISGVSSELQIGEEIPHYTQVPASIYMVINSSEKWTEESEQKEAENLYNVIQELQKQDIAIEVTLYFNDEETEKDNEKPGYHSITVSDKDFENIHSPEDVLEYSAAF